MTDAVIPAAVANASKSASAAPRKRPTTSAAKGAPVARRPKPAVKKVAVAKKATQKPAQKEAQKAPTANKVAKPRAKLVRDSFTMPQADFDLVAALKGRLLGLGRVTKKSELLRAGLQQLVTLSDVRLKLALAALVPLQAGRPKKD